MTNENDLLKNVENTESPTPISETLTLKKPFFKTKKFVFIVYIALILLAVAYYCISNYTDHGLNFPDEKRLDPCPECGMG